MTKTFLTGQLPEFSKRPNTWERLVTFLVILFIAVFIINNLIISFASPTQVGTEIKSAATPEYKSLTKNFPKTKIMTVDKLRSGGLGSFSAASRGYVNVFSSANTIYVDPSRDKMTRDRTTLLMHETGHVLQKELAAKQAGGYPSRINPVQSARYYTSLIQLNNVLGKYTPPVKKGYKHAIALEHIETNADCIVQAEGLWPKENTYIGIYFCNHRQLAAAYSVINKEWPTPSNISKYETLLKNRTLDPFNHH